MKCKKEEIDNGAKSSWSLGEIEEFFDKQAELAKREFNFLRAVSLITPEDEAAFRAAPIDVVLPKNDRQEDKALKELKRELRHEANRACIRKFLEIGRELKKSDPESKLFNMSEDLLDYLDRIESEPCSLGKYEWKRLVTGLCTYTSLLRGEAEKRCKETSAEKPTEKKQDIYPTKEKGEKTRLISSINIQNFKGILGDVHQSENLQIGDDARIDNQTVPEKRAETEQSKPLGKLGLIKTLLWKLYDMTVKSVLEWLWTKIFSGPT